MAVRIKGTNTDNTVENGGSKKSFIYDGSHNPTHIHMPSYTNNQSIMM